MNDISDMMMPLTGAPKRPKFAVVDLETKDGETQKGGFTRPFLSGYYDGEHFTCFRGGDCIKSMLLFLLSPRLNGMTYYAHNGGAFDWLHFLPMLTALGYSFEIITVSSKIQCLRVKPHKNSRKKGWTFLDSYQLIPAGLGKITKAFGTEVQKDTNFDYDTQEDDRRWDEYLEQDCISLHQTLIKFYDLVENYLGGEVGMTTASTAMKTYRRKYQEFPIERHSKYHEFFRSAYYGGRVEIFRERASNLHYYDINSAYPFAMLKPMPVGKLVECKGKPLKWMTEGRIGFARANVFVPEKTYIPVLPCRNQDGRLIFPTGSFTGVWTAIELFKAIEMGAKVEWLDSVWISARPIFSEFVTKLYTLRDKEREGYDESLAYVAKIMLNSLYGKFATNTLREKIIYVSENGEPPEGIFPINPEDPECSLYRIEEEIDAPYIVPQIAAHITALARLHLLSIMLEAHKHGTLAYCDTDSIITSANLSHICSSGLGSLKDEGEGVVYDGEFIQPKFYMLNGNDGSCKVTMKGYRDRTPESFNSVKLGGTLHFETLERIGAMVKKEFITGPKMISVKRSLQSEDRKRTHLTDGKTKPIVLNESFSAPFDRLEGIEKENLEDWKIEHGSIIKSSTTR